MYCAVSGVADAASMAGAGRSHGDVSITTITRTWGRPSTSWRPRRRAVTRPVCHRGFHANRLRMTVHQHVRQDPAQPGRHHAFRRELELVTLRSVTATRLTSPGFFNVSATRCKHGRGKSTGFHLASPSSSTFRVDVVRQLAGRQLHRQPRSAEPGPRRRNSAVIVRRRKTAGFLAQPAGLRDTVRANSGAVEPDGWDRRRAGHGQRYYQNVYGGSPTPAQPSRLLRHPLGDIVAAEDPTWFGVRRRSRLH